MGTAASARNDTQSPAGIGRAVAGNAAATPAERPQPAGRVNGIVPAGPNAWTTAARAGREGARTAPPVPSQGRRATRPRHPSDKRRRDPSADRSGGDGPLPSASAARPGSGCGRPWDKAAGYSRTLPFAGSAAAFPLCPVVICAACRARTSSVLLRAENFCIRQDM
jgi:hypothetical protein